MLNTDRLSNLVSAEYWSFVDDVDDVVQCSNAELPLSEICEITDLEALRQYMEDQYGIYYWLMGEVLVNPNRTYMMWISRTRGNDPHWGIYPCVLGPDESPEFKEARNRARFLERHSKMPIKRHPRKQCEMA